MFDNDGTMWCEKPNYPQLEFFLLELRQAIAADASVAERPEFRAVIDHDTAALQEIGLEALVTSLLDLFAGISPEDFDRRAEFVRVIGQDFYGVSPEGVVGSQIDYEFTHGDDGRARLLRTSHLVGSGPNEGVTKVANIHRILGRRPVVAGGNSAGDTEMLEYAMSYDGPSLAVLVNHDDAEREYAYESKAGTFDTDENILETAARLDWTVVSMRDDWARIFAAS